VTFCTPQLLRRLFDGASIPSAPVEIQIPRRRKDAILFRKQDHIVFEHDKQIGDLFTNYSFSVGLRFVPNDIRITPQREERLTSKFRQRAFGAR
jgi:hypothetical protein